jgi:hypothetical protein
MLIDSRLKGLNFQLVTLTRLTYILVVVFMAVREVKYANEQIQNVCNSTSLSYTYW